MKTTLKILSVVLIFLFSACDKEEVNLDSSGLPGKWVMSESLMDIGNGQGKWEKTKSNLVLELKVDGSLAGNAFPDYVRYTVKDSVTLVFHKRDQTEQNYRYEFVNGKLSMSPAGPIWCIEGCGTRYTRVND
jgi:hypothetical protein